MFDDDARFEHDVEIDDDRGRVRYRFFRRPLPVLVDALRAEVYARLTPIAGLYGRQPVMHGVQEVRAERYAVGIPFHDYAGG